MAKAAVSQLAGCGGFAHPGVRIPSLSATFFHWSTLKMLFRNMNVSASPRIMVHAVNGNGLWKVIDL